ncbi:MAG: rod shape-determining protein RodA [Mycobacteriales bacterium]
MTEWSTPRASPVSLRRTHEPLRSRAFARNSPLRRLDWVLAFSVVTLSLLGGLLVWSATRTSNQDGFLKRHLLNLAIGLLLASMSALVDYRMLRAYAPVVYVVSCLGLIAVLSPLGDTVRGQHSWITLPAGFQIQPSEFAKVALVVGMAMILGEKRDNEADPRDVDVVLVLVLAAVPMGLIMMQPDFGTTMVFVFTILGVLAVSGAPTRWVAGLVILGVLGGWGILHFDLLAEYQRERLTTFATRPDKARLQDSAYNVDQSVTAIGSGGMWGTGLFNGVATRGEYVPEQQTDFVFSAAGEELGFVGSGLILFLLMVLMYRGLRIAANAGDAFGMIVAAGVSSWFAFQIFVNVGMTMGIMPVTGLPLPFVSYGGSSMFANMLAIGLLQNVHMRSND